MGYTHTWHIAESSTDPRTADIGDDVRMLMMKSEIPVCLDYDQADQPPRIDDEKIQFNGPGEDGAETFGTRPVRTTPSGDSPRDWTSARPTAAPTTS